MSDDVLRIIRTMSIEELDALEGIGQDVNPAIQREARRRRTELVEPTIDQRPTTIES